MLSVKLEWFSPAFSLGLHAALLCHKAVHTHFSPHAFFAVWLMFSNNKCFGKENILLQFHVSRLSVNVRMGSQLGKPSLYLWSYMSCLSEAVQLVVYSPGNRVSSVLCTYVCGARMAVCVYKKSPVLRKATVLGGKHGSNSSYAIYCP